MEVTAVCHVHSEWSYDAKWTLAELSEKFRRRGVRVLMMTEHDRGFSPQRFEEFRRACAAVSSEKILVVPGIEYSDGANRVHVLTWGPIPFLGENLPTAVMLEEVRQAKGVAVFAHPSRKRAYECFAPYWAERLLGIEAWNRKYDGWAPSETSPALLQQSKLVPFVGLDFHTQRQSFPLTMTFDIQGEINEANVLECLRARRCSARAFGAPLQQNLWVKAAPMLRMAERGRSAAASLVRKTRVLSR